MIIYNIACNGGAGAGVQEEGAAEMRAENVSGI